MIVLEKDNRKMSVCTEVQASAFISCGWRRTDVPNVQDSISEKTESGQSGGEKKYTRTEISRMKTDDLRALAAKEGINATGGSTGADLKDVLIEHFGI